MIQYVNYLSLLIIPLFILFTILYGTVKKIRVYDSFIAGAKEGPAIILNIFPYLLTIFVAIKGFQASGAFDYIRNGFYHVFAFLDIPIEEAKKRRLARGGVATREEAKADDFTKCVRDNFHDMACSVWNRPSYSKYPLLKSESILTIDGTLPKDKIVSIIDITLGLSA